jgi:putative transposase
LPAQQRGSHLRRGRHSECGRIYLLTSITHNRDPIFSDFRLGRLLVKEFRKAQDQQLVNSLAWVVMPDHFHWLVELCSNDLSSLMRKVKTKSSLAITEAKGERFKLWQKGYHDRAIRQESEIIQAARYIIANPIRAGLVKRYGDYPLWDAVWL